jgi:glycosyltransferase involved in cell wall biosynthesis
MIATGMRVAIEPADARLSARTGHGRVWQELVRGLREHHELQVAWSRRRRPWRVVRRRPDVWLVDGHRQPRPVTEPVVSLVHEASWMDPFLRSFLAESFVARLAPATAAAVRASIAVVTPSTSSSRQVVDIYGMDPGRVFCVPYGVDLECFRPGVKGGRDLVAAARGGPPARYVLFVGTATPRKNVGALRAAMAGLVARGAPQVLALVFSDAPDRHSQQLIDELRAPLAGHSNRVVVIRAPSDRALAALMAGADAFCLPSYWEGFGLPVLEAMACGTPVVAAARASLPDVVDDAGLLVEPDPESIESGLDRVLKDTAFANALRIKARRRAESFPWSRTVDGCRNVLQFAAEEGRIP